MIVVLKHEEAVWIHREFRMVVEQLRAEQGLKTKEPHPRSSVGRALTMLREAIARE